MRGWLASALVVNSIASAFLSEASAQPSVRSAGVTLTAGKVEPVEADPGSAATLVFSIRNGSRDSLDVSPAIDIPENWTVLVGQRAFRLGPSEAEVWIVSLAIPANAAAGRHVIRIGATTASSSGKGSVADTAVVLVNRKQALSFVLIDHPVYVISGDSYKLTFRVANRGNSTTTVLLSGKSSLNGVVRFDPAELLLESGKAQSVTASVSSAVAAGAALDDVVEAYATEASDIKNAHAVSARVTLVARPGSGRSFVTVPAALKVRAPARGTDVSRFEISGAGRMNEERLEQIEFLFRGPTAQNSAFGDRAENRVEIRAAEYRVRLGDNYFNLSQLTGGGQQGFGLGLDLTGKNLSGGTYSQRFRFEPGSNSERGGYVRLTPAFVPISSSISVNAIDRKGGSTEGRIVSSVLNLRPFSAMEFAAEYALSRSDSGAGSASSLRWSGTAPISYDFAHVAGDSGFAGPTRNASSQYLTLSRDATKEIRLIASGSRSEFRVPSAEGLSPQRFSTASAGGTYAGRFSAEWLAVRREYQRNPNLVDTLQHLLKVRLETPWRYGTGWASVESGRSVDSTVRGMSHLVLLGGNVSLGRSLVSGYAELYNGGSLSKGRLPATTYGGSGSLRLTQSNSITFFGHHTRYRSLNTGYHQIDARFSHTFLRGASLSFRARVSSLSSPTARPEKLAYLEYGLPFRLPTSRSRRPGSVSGRVIDGETGHGLAGALVRLGAQAAVTDRNGHVSFADLAPGEHRVSLASDPSISSAVFAGDPVVRVDTLRRAAPGFVVAVSRASKARGIVKQFARARTSLAAAPDSLVESGPLADVTVALVGLKDTLYRVSGADGTVMFDGLPAGDWTMVVQGDAPFAFRYEHSSVHMTIAPGKEAEVEFRLVPRQRPVEIIAGDLPQTPRIPAPSPSRSGATKQR